MTDSKLLVIIVSLLACQCGNQRRKSLFTNKNGNGLVG